jgi:hypothetical protein
MTSLLSVEVTASVSQNVEKLSASVRQHTVAPTVKLCAMMDAWDVDNVGFLRRVCQHAAAILVTVVTSVSSHYA